MEKNEQTHDLEASLQQDLNKLIDTYGIEQVKAALQKKEADESNNNDFENESITENELPPDVNNLSEFESGINQINEHIDAGDKKIISKAIDFCRELQNGVFDNVSPMTMTSLILSNELALDTKSPYSDWITRNYEVIRDKIKNEMKNSGYRFYDNNRIGQPFDSRTDSVCEAIETDDENVIRNKTILGIRADGYSKDDKLQVPAVVIIGKKRTENTETPTTKQEKISEPAKEPDENIKTKATESENENELKIELPPDVNNLEEFQNAVNQYENHIPKANLERIHDFIELCSEILNDNLENVDHLKMISLILSDKLATHTPEPLNSWINRNSEFIKTAVKEKLKTKGFQFYGNENRLNQKFDPYTDRAMGSREVDDERLVRDAIILDVVHEGYKNPQGHLEIPVGVILARKKQS